MKVNEDALASVAAALGIIEPVTVRLGDPREAAGADAWYRAMWGGKGHVVSINPMIARNPCRAQEVVLHELTHAAQCERMGSFAAVVSLHQAQMKAAGLPMNATRVTREYIAAYNAIPLEAEANANEARAEDFDLILSDDDAILS